MDHTTPLEIGMTASISKTFDTKHVQAFAELCGDFNPLHLNEEFAKKTHFGRCIVHGTFYTSILGTILGTMLPGKGTILISQQHQFKAPVFVGDEVTARVEITGLKQEKGIVILQLKCFNQNGVEVLDGSAVTKKVY